MQTVLLTDVFRVRFSSIRWHSKISMTYQSVSGGGYDLYTQERCCTACLWITFVYLLSEDKINTLQKIRIEHCKQESFCFGLVVVCRYQLESAFWITWLCILKIYLFLSP